LDLYWRQWGSRYTIHAGRNLPVKEFRYLRTVRVTAAVYGSLYSEREPLLLTLPHRAGVSPYTSSYDFAETCVFIKQSLPPILCRLLQRPLLSRSYEVNLPSSFNIVIPSALVHLHPSTCVGFRTIIILKLFPGIHQITFYTKKEKLYFYIQNFKKYCNQRCKKPIDYSFRFYLRDRLTVICLPVSTKPWTYGDNV